ncbi:Fic family protein [Candidatus Woesearchaeota archaeon]|nr:Fic family protein [Candidatus Woesearchaeota archaeon]
MKLRKRYVRNKVYYYIEHSLRENGKITKKERYLGTSIPKNIEEIKKEFKKEIEIKLFEKLGRIKENFQVEWRRIPESAKQKEKEEIAIAFTYNTNAIEGSTITLEETREIIHDKFAPNKSLRDIKETEAHGRVFLAILDKKEKITKGLLLKWHEDIFGDVKPDISGKFRDYLVRVGPYLAPDWQDVEDMMKKLIAFINENLGKMNTIELAARSHYRFEKIHPFGDGNGRIGRLLMNYIIWHTGYPMLIIEYKKRKSYYNALQGDEERFLKYFMRRYLAVHKKRLK